MYWQENDDDSDECSVPGEVVDLLFSIRCQSLPLDHGYSLSMAIQQILPWINNEPCAAIQQIHVAESSHGWKRPDHDNALLLPSRRTRLMLRMPAHRVDDCRQLENQLLDIDGHDLNTGPFRIRSLSRLTTLMSRYTLTRQDEPDEQFIERIYSDLQERGIGVKKMLSGLVVKHSRPEGSLLTRKLMLAGLTQENALSLQQQGLDDLQLMGIGVFLPHKGIDAVKPG